MNRVPGRRDEISVFYPQAGHFVGYLINAYGHERVAVLLENLDSGQEIADAFHSTYGESLYDVENTWRSTLGAGPLPTPDSARAQLPPPVMTQIPLLKPPTDTVKSPTSEGAGESVNLTTPAPTTAPAPTSAPHQEASDYGSPAEVLDDGTPGRFAAIAIIAVSLGAFAAISGAFAFTRLRTRRRRAIGS